MARERQPGWLFRIEMLGTTLTVLLVASVMIWYEAIERETRLAFTIGGAVLLYVLGLVLLASSSDARCDRLSTLCKQPPGMVRRAV